MLIPKSAESNGRYLAYIRSLPCEKCGSVPPCEAHHQPAIGHGSMGSKCSDYRAIPLCSSCHHILHTVGRHTFWSSRNVEETIFRLQVGFFFCDL